MAEFRRIILYFGLALVAFLLWGAWERDHAEKKPDQKQEVQQKASETIPVQKDEKTVSAHSNIPVGTHSNNNLQSSIPKERLIHVKTDVVDVLIDKLGGNIVKWDLLKYPVSLKSELPVTLFNAQTLKGNPNYSLGVSGVISETGPDSQSEKGLYESEKAEYVLQPDENTLQIKLHWKNAQGLKVQKTFVFERGKYSVDVNHLIENEGKAPWSGNFYAEIKQKETESESNSMALSTFTGGAFSTEKNHYEKISFKKMNKSDLDQASKGGWLAFQKRYFLTSWIPSQDQTNRYYTRANAEDKLYTVGVVGPEIALNAGEKREIKTALYAGPEVAKDLKKLAPHLDLTVDYGWLWFLAGPIFWVMDQIHKLVGNWGVSIILVTLLIKLAFYHLSATSYRSTAKMQKLTPQLQRIREQYKDDRQKMSQETMALYRREKVNPLSGCLPMIVQIPFFFALYYVLIESVELRQAPFILWIQDLSIKDPYYVLPILMGITMFIQQKLNPTPPDPMQAKIMMFMPLMFTVFFLNFPAGLVLYWLTNNCLSILQQWWIIRTVTHKK